MADNDIDLDTVLDYTNTLCNTPAKAQRRERAMERAHEQGHAACEVCGRGLVAGRASVNGLPVGPTCLTRLLRWLRGAPTPR